MHSVLYYLLATVAITGTSSLVLYLISEQYGKRNFYSPDQIVKGNSDVNEYTLFSLPNQMKVMIITSNNTEISAASLRVGTGSMADPIEFQGMAHFVEHMLFLGSEKYPQEDIFRKTLAMNAGQSSAQTNEVDSSFGFSVQNSAFYIMLDMFSRFFIDPTFSSESMNREVQSVHSEWKNSLTNKDRKIWFVIRHLSRSGHPFGKFPTGNLKTLMEDPIQKGLDPHLALKKFYRNQYSANRMSLVIFTHERMRQRATELVFEYYQQITDKQLTDHSYTSYGLPITPGNFIRLHTDSNDQDFVIWFNLEGKTNLNTKMIQFAAYMLMNFFKVNYCVQVIGQRWVSECQWTVYEIPHEFSFFVLQLKLTKIGKQQIDNLLREFFARINHLKQVDQATFQSYYELLHDIQAIQFDYKEPGQLQAMVRHHTQRVAFNFGKRVLVDQDVLHSFDWQALQQLCKSGFTAENANFILRNNFTHAQTTEDVYVTPQQLQESLGEKEQTLANAFNIQCVHDEVPNLLLQQNPAGRFERIKIKRRLKVPKHQQVSEEEESEQTPEIGHDEVEKQVKDYVNEQSIQPDASSEDSEEQTTPEIEGQFDFSIDRIKELWTIPFSNFKFSYIYGINHLDAKITQKTVKQLTSQPTDQDLADIDQIRAVLPKSFNVYPPPLYQSTPKHQRSYRKQLFRYPELLESSPQGNLWWVRDTSLRVPKVAVRVIIRYLNYNKLDVDVAYALLMIQMEKLKWQFNVNLEKYMLVALEKLDLQYASLGTFEITYQCYSDMLPAITEEIFQIVELNRGVTKQEDLDWLIDMAQVQQQDSDQRLLYEQGLKYLKGVISGSPAYRILNFQRVRKIKDFVEQHNLLVSTQRWDVLLYGNIDSSKAKQLWSKQIKPHQDTVPSKEFNRNDLPSINILKLTKHPLTYRLRFHSFDPVNVVTINYYQGSDRNLAQYTYMRLIQPQLQSYAFDYLRTQLQLGYIVQCQIVSVGLVDGLAVLVQSPNYDPEEIDFYIEECLGYFENYLQKLSDRDFHITVEALKKELQQMPPDLAGQSDIVWNPIRQGDYYFTMRECMVIALEKITKVDLQKFFNIFFKTRNSKLTLQLYNSHQQQSIPTEVLREQDTFSRQKSKFVGTEDELRKEITEFYKYQHRYITEAPDYVC